MKRIIDTASKAALSLGLTHTFAHIELCSTQNRTALFEASPRCGGGATASCVVPQVTGLDIPDCVIALCIGEHLTVSPMEPPRGCCYRFLTPLPESLSASRGLVQSST